MSDNIRPYENINEFWETNHKTNNHYYLTGTEGDNQREILQLNDIVNKGSKLLNIGVGKGFCTKYWVEYGCVVSVLDISQTAIDKVKNITEKEFLDSNIEDLPTDYFDYITSLLVIQHMNTFTLTRHMKNVIRSLKSKSGLFAFQFSYSLNGQINDNSLATCQKGKSTRTVDEMINIIDSNNAKVINIFDAGEYPSYNLGWKIFHVKKD